MNLSNRSSEVFSNDFNTPVPPSSVSKITISIYPDLVLHAKEDQFELDMEFEFFPLSRGSAKHIKAGDWTSYLADLYINGFGHRINTEKQVISPNRDPFINEYFELYQPIKDMEYRNAVFFFLEDYLSEELDLNLKQKRSLTAIDKIYDFLVKKGEAILENTEWGKYPQFSVANGHNPDNWEYKTIKQLRSFLRLYLEDRISQGHDNDILNIFRTLFQTGVDGSFTIRANPGASSGYVNLYSANPVFNEGIKIPITLDEILKLITPKDFKDFSTDLLSLIQSNTVNLNFDTFWKLNEKNMGDKLEKAYKIYKDMFSQENLGDLYDQKFRIHFHHDGGSGPTRKSVAQRFKLKENYIDFTPSKPSELHSAIAGMLTYLISLPDTYVDIKKPNSKTFLFADLYSLLSPEYISDNNIAQSNKPSGTFFWDGSRPELTPLKYQQYQNQINGKIFTYKDFHHFLAFDSSFESMLKTLNTFFIQLDTDITIKNLNDPTKNFVNLYPV